MASRTGKRRNASKAVASAVGNDRLTAEVLKSGLAPERESRREDRDAYEQLIAQYYERFRPDGPAERCLLDDLIYCDWSIRRCQRMQAEGRDIDADWQSLLATKQEAYRSALKTLRDYQAHPIPGPAPSDQGLKVTIH